MAADIDDDMADYVDNNAAAYIDDDMSAYMDDVDDDVATSLAHQICTAHKNSSPPQPSYIFQPVKPISPL